LLYFHGSFVVALLSKLQSNQNKTPSVETVLTSSTDSSSSSSDEDENTEKAWNAPRVWGIGSLPGPSILKTMLRFVRDSVSTPYLGHDAQCSLSSESYTPAFARDHFFVFVMRGQRVKNWVLRSTDLSNTQLTRTVRG
jgi:hypothetical protein